MKALPRSFREVTASLIQLRMKSVSSKTNVKLPEKKNLKEVCAECDRNICRKATDDRQVCKMKTLDGDRWLFSYEPDTDEKINFAINDQLKYLQKAPCWVINGMLQKLFCNCM